MRSVVVASLAVLPVACTFGSTGGTAGLGSAGTETTDAGEGPADTAGAISSATTTGSGGADQGEGPQLTSADDTAGVSSSGDEGSGSDTTTTSSPTTTGGGEPFVPCDPADPELRACYDFFGVGGGVLTDLSSHGNHGTALGVDVEAGPFGEAARFSVDTEVSIPDSASLDVTLPFSFEAWVWIEALPGGGRQGILDNDGQYSLMLYAASGLRCAGGGGNVFSAEVPLAQWTHVACVHDGAALSIWVDGRFVASTPTTDPANTDNTEPISLGDTSPGFDEPLDGMIGAVRVWGVALDPKQIAAAAATAG